MSLPRFRSRALNRPAPKDANTLEDFLWQVHEYTDEYIRFADAKAAFIVAAASTLIGTAISSLILQSVFRKAIGSWYASQWLAALGLLFLSLSTLCSIKVIWPRLWNKTPIGFIFWESIAGHGSAGNYGAAIHKTGAHERTTAISDHLFALSGVAKAKYRWVTYSLWLGVPGGVFTAIAMFIQHGFKS